jgi:hypothetical protein
MKRTVRTFASWLWSHRRVTINDLTRLAGVYALLRSAPPVTTLSENRIVVHSGSPQGGVAPPSGGELGAARSLLTTAAGGALGGYLMRPYIERALARQDEK